MPESKELALTIAKALDSKKGQDIKMLETGHLTTLADYFVLCSATSSTQIKALADVCEKMLKDAGEPPHHVEGHRGGTWVLLDFGNPASAKVWQQVVEASRSLNPAQCKIVVFGNSRENYGTDLMGLAIWISYQRKGQAMSYLTYALDRWNEVKAGQKRTRGKAIPFTNEYDATVQPTDFPIHYAYLQRLNPPVPASQEMDVTSYCYDAGSVNMYQAVQLARHYKLSGLPALVADGRVIPASSSASAIVGALR